VIHQYQVWFPRFDYLRQPPSAFVAVKLPFDHRSWQDHRKCLRESLVAHHYITTRTVRDDVARSFFMLLAIEGGNLYFAALAQVFQDSP
jgi:hypothetical protein